jgi:hypothetical protein
MCTSIPLQLFLGQEPSQNQWYNVILAGKRVTGAASQSGVPEAGGELPGPW